MDRVKKKFKKSCFNHGDDIKEERKTMWLVGRR